MSTDAITLLKSDPSARMQGITFKPKLWSAHMPCPEGTTGEGYFYWQVYDDVTGEAIASGCYGEGCVDNPPDN